MQYLGQHFLKNKSAIAKIVSALELKKGDIIIEIGPGKGALTIPLVRKCAGIGCKIMAIEKDEELGSGVQGLGFRKEVLEVRIGDALKELPSLVNLLVNRRGPSAQAPQDDGREMAVTYKIVGNIPYYITGHLLRVISELPVKPSLTVLMVQKEVAERVSAKPGKMNLLAAATQIWADISILFTLKPADFNPPPEVESAIIKLRQVNSERRAVDTEKYYKFIHAVFKQPRKTLLNNIADGFGITKGDALNIIAPLGYNEKTRAQELSVGQLEEISKKDI